MASVRPKISFGIIVLNGEPFTAYTLRALYPFAHQIIVAEGASQYASVIATQDGHSKDGTLETLHRFKKEEDPENKVIIIPHDGFWSEKDEQSRAYTLHATGDYIWQVDIDEFYHPEDMRRVIEILGNDPEITAVALRQITFWGGFDYLADSWYLMREQRYFWRIFKWGTGFVYSTHRPPTVLDAEGRDLRIHGKILDGRELEKQNILLYHYSLLFPKQVFEKSAYYDRAPWISNNRYVEWAENTYRDLKRPYHAHNVYTHPGWLYRFRGKHPPQIEQMKQDLLSGKLNVAMRSNQDVEKLLNSLWYPAGARFLQMWEPVDRIVDPLLFPFRLTKRVFRRGLRMLRHS